MSKEKITKILVLGGAIVFVVVAIILRIINPVEQDERKEKLRAEINDICTNYEKYFNFEKNESLFEVGSCSEKVVVSNVYDKNLEYSNTEYSFNNSEVANKYWTNSLYYIKNNLDESWSEVDVDLILIGKEWSAINFYREYLYSYIYELQKTNDEIRINIYFTPEANLVNKYYKLFLVGKYQDISLPEEYQSKTDIIDGVFNMKVSSFWTPEDIQAEYAEEYDRLVK